MVIARKALLCFWIEPGMIEMLVEPIKRRAQRIIEHAQIELVSEERAMDNVYGCVPAQIRRKNKKRKKEPERNLLPGFPWGIQSSHNDNR